MRLIPALLLTLIVLTLTGNRAVAQTPTLHWPLHCTVPHPCVIQNYVDTDDAPGMQDYRCGGAGYADHSGTDFRLPDGAAMAEGVGVGAAAPGIVKGVRDGMEDRVATDPLDPALAGRECGNGVVVDHGGGWETQYCHLRRGSVRVRVGDAVQIGQPLGLVGLSGSTEFPHLHLAVRHNGQIVDPFTGQIGRSGCPQSTQGGLWSASLPAEALAYRGRHLFQAGFSSRLVTRQMLDEAGLPPATAQGPVLVAYATLIHLEAGDVFTLTLTGPAGFNPAVAKTEPMDRFKAQYNQTVGRRLTARRWPPGLYRATASVIDASGQSVLEESWTLVLGD